jgi:hypothetical protein
MHFLSYSDETVRERHYEDIFIFAGVRAGSEMMKKAPFPDVA